MQQTSHYQLNQWDAEDRIQRTDFNSDNAKVDAALDLLMVIKYLERIGDHAVNVAEWVQFVRTGRYKDESMF